VALIRCHINTVFIDSVKGGFNRVSHKYCFIDSVKGCYNQVSHKYICSSVIGSYRYNTIKQDNRDITFHMLYTIEHLSIFKHMSFLNHKKG